MNVKIHSLDVNYISFFYVGNIERVSVLHNTILCCIVFYSDNILQYLANNPTSYQYSFPPVYNFSEYWLVENMDIFLMNLKFPNVNDESFSWYADVGSLLSHIMN